MTQFMILTILAILIEAIVTLVLGDIPTIPGWVKKITSIILGIMFCVLWKVGLLALLGIQGGVALVDYVATGIIISRGSNFLHDVITRMKGEDNLPSENA